LSGFCHHECTVELLEASRDDCCKYLNTQFRTYLSSYLVVDILLNWLSYPSLLPDSKSRDTLLVLERENAVLIDEDATVVLRLL